MSDFVSVRLTNAERKLVKAAAAQAGVSVSEWLRLLMKRAVETAVGSRDPEIKKQ